ncbi:hypothetical protein MMC21_006307 [Puttea exsequens]|nr:hypothetical protein [Puttea exsequens]
MSAVVAASSQVPAFGEAKLLTEYNKLIALRNNVFASRNLPIKPSETQGNLSSSPQQPANSRSQAPNDLHNQSESNGTAPTQRPGLNGLEPPSDPLQSKTSKPPVPSTVSSSIDPIFLTKSDVLVKAEIQQKRQRLERMLEEQNQRKRQRVIDPDALPDFDVTEVLRKAQELVKPTKVRNASGANGGTSSSSSFDENTLYSSQMDESTTTEEVDESRKWRPHRMCNFFVKGKHCPYGENCQFSHDPAMKQRVNGGASKAANGNHVNADEHTSSQNDHAKDQGPSNGTTQHRASRPSPDLVTAGVSQKERELQQRVAQLEAELRNTKPPGLVATDAMGRQELRDQHDSQEDSAYSPPPPDEFGRDVSLREVGSRQPRTITQHRPPVYGQPMRERPPSPLSANMRVVQNGIPSPLAPQPQRVSPLAVAKAPQVTQLQREAGETRRAFNSRAANATNGSAVNSPNVMSHPTSSKKRRRGADQVDETRNVVARRNNDSPAVRIKAEPVSPPPFNVREIRQTDRDQESQQQLYGGGAEPQHPEREPNLQQSRFTERPVYDDRRPITPVARRVISRNGHYISNEEPDLRRVVSARQARAQLSPAPYPLQHSAPQQRTSRAASQVYISPSSHPAPQEYRTSVQSQPVRYIEDRSPSPPHQMQSPPPRRQSVIMAPPPRRIVVDQYGNQFEEVPAPRHRQISLAPIRRESDHDARYEPLIPRGTSVRQPQYMEVGDESQYIRRAPSPTSPRYYESAQPVRRQVLIGSRGELLEEDPYVATRPESRRIIEYADDRRYAELPPSGERIIRIQSVRPGTAAEQSENRPSARYAETLPPPPLPPSDGTMRMQSVRPVERQYEAPLQERVVSSSHIQSVRPTQPRIVSLGEKGEAASPRVALRQLSVRPEGGGLGRPRYQYLGQVQEGDFVE